jgi:hypothetical protein
MLLKMFIVEIVFSTGNNPLASPQHLSQIGLKHFKRSETKQRHMECRRNVNVARVELCFHALHELIENLFSLFSTGLQTNRIVTSWVFYYPQNGKKIRTSDICCMPGAEIELEEY